MSVAKRQILTNKVLAPFSLETQFYPSSPSLHGPSRTSGVSRMFEDEFGRRSHAPPSQLVTGKLRKLLLEPGGERLLRSHESPERLFRALRLHVGQDHVPSGHPGEVYRHAADVHVPP